MNKSVILLSGGLDSLVALGYSNRLSKYNIELGLTFDYGQKSAMQEIEYSQKAADFYNIRHKVIKLDWLKDITHTSLVSDADIPEKDLNSVKSAAQVWVPNRNSLFLNIAACFCDSYGYDFILYGANKDEGKTFPDNTEEFRASLTEVFKTSTLVHPQVVAPLINYGKDDIVKIAVENNIPLEYVWSCYTSGEKHCGKCESCRHLKRALINNNCYKYINILFGENEN